MNQRVVFRGVSAGLFLALIVYGFFQFPEIERLVLERLINQGARIFFSDSIHIEKVTVDRSFKIRLQGITGSFQARQGPVPLEIRLLESREPLFFILGAQPVRFIFEGARPKSSSRSGLWGEISVRGGKDWRVEVSVDFKNTNLEDLRWLDPQNLDGANGAMIGKLTCIQTAGNEPVFDLKISVPPPGGTVQARFFDLFLPYLPASIQKDRVMKLVSEKKQLVQYQTAELEMALPQSDSMKILLRILVLDYNLKLTLNMTVRTEQKDSFMQIARIMGLIEAKAS